MQQHLGATVLYCWKCFFEPISLPKVRRVSWPEKAWVFYIICISYFPLHLRHSIAFIYLTWLAPPWLAVYGQSWPSDLGIFDIVEQPASRSERFELRQFNVFKIVQITILWSLFLTTAKWLSGPLLWAQSFSRVRLFVTPRTIALLAPLSMGFPRQEYWSGFPSPSPGDCHPTKG